jgi:hypothetical protein
MEINTRTWLFAALFVALGVALCTLYPWMVYNGLKLAFREEIRMEVVLPILLTSGVICLLASLALVALSLTSVGLSDKSQPLGLPQGTVQAVIALSLILIYVITSVHLYRQLNGDVSQIVGLTQAQLADIPSQEIVSSKPSQVGEGLFDVERRLANAASQDFAKQMLTTISTLVVAVAAFYFGTRAVEGARERVEPPTLRILSPGSPAKLKKDAGLPIRLETTPAGLAVEGKVDGYIDESLRQIRHDAFEYRPTETPTKPVTLTFALAAHPGEAKDLIVEVEPPPQPTPLGES